MEYYAILSIATVVFLVLTWLIWSKTKSLAFLLGNGFLYLWSLWGAWFVVRDLLTAQAEGPYQYLRFKLFPIYLDADYLWTIVLYALFMVIVQCTVLFTVKKIDTREVTFKTIQISHLKMIVLGAFCGGFSYLIIRPSLAAAAEMNASGYVYVKSDESLKLYSVFQLTNRAALIALVMGIVVYFSGQQAKYLRGRPNVFLLVAYFACLGGVFLLNMLLGERSELLTAACFGGLLYIANTPKPSKLLIGGGAFAALAGLAIVGFTRGSSFNNVFSGVGLSSLFVSIADMSRSVEWFAPHFSLYGAIHKAVPFTYGTSFANLLLSAVPRIVWPDRPPDIYEHYANNVQAVPDQGYAIHHATGWYLNFGVIGLIAGALLWGWLWATLFNKFKRAESSRFHLGRAFAVVAVWSFTADIPTLIRAGIEGYKPVLIQTFFIPVMIIALTSLTVVQRAGHLQLAFGATRRRSKTAPVLSAGNFRHPFPAATASFLPTGSPGTGYSGETR
jgi:hypothetical protein